MTDKKIINGSTYISKKFSIKNTVYTVTVVSGKSNYINVFKPNVFKSLGKQFKSFDEAVKHYKNPQIKVELLKIETGIN